MSDPVTSFPVKYKGIQLQDNKRTELTRQHSDHVLSYYESSIPNEAVHSPRAPSSPNKPSANNHKRTLSGGSSSSAYSNNNADQNDKRDTGSETSASVTKRLRTPSKGGADRRRLAIVQLDSSRSGTQLQPTRTTTGSIRERRGYKSDLTGLALIAPPDAASHTYTQLTPPSTAPLTGDMISRALKTVVHDKAHHRSASDIAQSVSSRSIMGVTKMSRTWRNSHNKSVLNNDETREALPVESSQSATPKTADHTHLSPGLRSSPYLTLDLPDFGSPISTPQIGEAKEIHMPVAAPIVMKMENVALPRQILSTSRAESPSSTVCGHGQSGQSTINEYKTSDLQPARLQSPALTSITNVASEIGQGRQNRSSTVAASRSPKMNEVKATNDTEVHDSFMGQTKESIQEREAITTTKEPGNLTLNLEFSQNPSPNLESKSLTLEESISSQQDDTLEVISPRYRVLPPTPIAKPPSSEHAQKINDASPPKVDHTRFDKWLKENPQFATRRGASLDESLRSPASVDHLTVEPPETPLKGLRRSLTTKVRRLSRAASLSSKSGASRSSQETRYSQRTPSPLSNYQARASPLNSHRRVISMNPAALFCHEIGGQTTTLQRCSIYANKINELSMYDCGLSDWIVQMKDQSLAPQRQRGPSSRSFVPQPRHTSRSSVMSQATFPRRLDATTATDLSPGQFDDVSSPGVPQLPYPSLAHRSVPVRLTTTTTSSSSVTPPTPLRSLTPSFSTTGFFSALGRKASLSRRDRPVLSTRISSPGVAPSGARLPPGKINQSINPRPIQITSVPTIPGGPRAPPSRSKRSQNYHVRSISAAAYGDISGPPSSLNDQVALDNVIDIKPDPKFTEQVDKLAGLIPQADRNILAGYLRRAGSDMLAIGQYLEDERMGVVRSH